MAYEPRGWKVETLPAEWAGCLSSRDCQIRVPKNFGLPVFRRFRETVKSECWLRHVCPRGTTGSHWTDFREI